MTRENLKKDKYFGNYAYLSKADLEGLINAKFINQLSNQASDDED